MSLRKKLIKLAYHSPELRADLLPILKESASPVTQWDERLRSKKWIRAYRCVGGGWGTMTDAIRGAVYFFTRKSSAELWCSRQGEVIERDIRIDTACVQAVHEGELSNYNRETGKNCDVAIRTDPDGSNYILEIAVFNKNFIRE